MIAERLSTKYGGVRMQTKGFANIAAFREEVKRLSREFGLEVTHIDIQDKTKKGSRVVGIEVRQALDIDPTEESNAVSWGNN